MHKNVQTNPKKSQKFTQHSCCSMLTREKKLKAIRGNGYHFVPKGGTFPTKNHHACCEKLRFVRSIYPNLPQMGQNLYHSMLMPLHDSMPSFMKRHQHAVVQILSHLGQVWGYASHKPELLTTSLMVSVGNVPLLGTKRYPLPLITFKKISPVNIEQ